MNEWNLDACRRWTGDQIGWDLTLNGTAKTSLLVDGARVRTSHPFSVVEEWEQLSSLLLKWIRVLFSRFLGFEWLVAGMPQTPSSWGISILRRIVLRDWDAHFCSLKRAFNDMAKYDYHKLASLQWRPAATTERRFVKRNDNNFIIIISPWRQGGIYEFLRRKGVKRRSKQAGIWAKLQPTTKLNQRRQPTN